MSGATSGAAAGGATTGRIRLLAPEVVERIAAGEVIERPASVVKELLENAFDAGARSVTVEIEEGGVSLLRVSDDGSGILFDDAPALCRRHSTSKLRRDDELERLSTFGFRGEALASIAAVAEIDLLSRHGSDETGFRLRVVGGEREVLTRAARTIGTTITVRRLFYNTPVRERFLRAGREETLEVARVITRYAGARPEIGFRFVRDGEETLNLLPAGDLEARWRALYGADVARDLLPLDWSESEVRVRGAVSRASTTRGNAAEIHVFVNGRMVTDRGITGSLLAGYHGLLSPRRYPRAIVLIELPADTVDVNVHPAKREVRLARRDRVQDAVRRGASRALVRDLDPGRASVTVPGTASPSGPLEASHLFAREPDITGASSGGDPALTGMRGIATEGALAHDAASSPRPATFEGLPLQIDRTFILTVDDDGVRLYDQHTAHERVLFEDALRRIEARRGEAQELLIPSILTLTPDEEAALGILLPALTALGYDIAPFGERTVAIRAHPSTLRRWDGGAGLRRMLSEGDSAEGGGARRVASSYACRHAVMAGETMTRAEMLALVAALRRAEEPALCPHGRPTVVTITPAELRRRFKRE